MAAIRSPIVAVMGHVDHGKTLLLDQIRGTAIQLGEAGGITQAIGASIIPLGVIKQVCGDLLKSLNIQFTLPGLLFIDTPGHAAFTSLRKRGGSIADIAILVIDINEGIKPQTQEAVEILKQAKTPFIVAANKIDLISGWKKEQGSLLEIIEKQAEGIKNELDRKLYELVGKLHESDFNSERFDRIEDYTKQVAIVPCSAKTGEGVPELLMVITGLAQKYLEGCLTCEVEGSAKGTILEVKEEKGLGTTLDVIIYDGTLKKGGSIVIGTTEEPIVTKVKALLEPMPLAEMRDKKSKFRPVNEVTAATGVKISAIGIERAAAGMPLRGCKQDEIENVKRELKKEIEEILIETDKEGIVIKADTLGSLEALTKLLKEKGVLIKRADIGDITKKDVSEAETNYEKNPLYAAVLGFNVKSDIKSKKVRLMTNNVIYKLIEDFEKWVEIEKARGEEKKLDVLARPCKLEILKGYVFRQSNPAIVGVEVLLGIAKNGTGLMKTGRAITEIKSMQHEKENISKAEKGKKVAMSLDRVMVGRQIKEGDILYSFIPQEDFRKLKELKRYLKPDEIECLKEIAEIMRTDNPMWGV